MSNQIFDLIIRASVVYFFILLAIRISGKKEMSQMSVADFVLILLVSNAVQNAMIGPYNSLWAGLIAASTLFLVNYILKRYLYKFSFVKKTFEGEAILLIYKGKLQVDKMRKANITSKEIEMLIRENGIENVSKVKLGILELDGKISFITY